MNIIYSLADFSQRMDRRVTVQVPATAGRKAYSYEREASGKPETDSKRKSGNPTNAGLKLAGPAILAAGLVGAQALIIKGRREERAAHEKRMNDFSQKGEEYRKRWQDFYSRTSSRNEEEAQDDAYKALGVKKGASQAEIRNATEKL